MIKTARNYGFTLIEILVVVALIGALFLGLLATVDPLEQLKKGGDTAKRNLTAQLYNGFIQYYSTQNTFPWTGDVSALLANDNTMTAAATGFIPMAISQGVFKADFINLAGSNLSKIFLTSTADAQGNRQNLASCFLPDAKSFRLEANAKYGKDGQVSSNCLSATAGGNPCYWCIK